MVNSRADGLRACEGGDFPHKYVYKQLNRQLAKPVLPKAANIKFLVPNQNLIRFIFDFFSGCRFVWNTADTIIRFPETS